MARPRYETPTPAELEVLTVIWERGECTVREVMDTLNRQRKRAYTSVMSLLNVMTEKGLLKRRLQGRAFLYSARVGRRMTRSRLLGDLLRRAFEGSPTALVAQLLDQAQPTEKELEKIRTTIEEYKEADEGNSPCR